MSVEALFEIVARNFSSTPITPAINDRIPRMREQSAPGGGALRWRAQAGTSVAGKSAANDLLEACFRSASRRCDRSICGIVIRRSMDNTLQAYHSSDFGVAADEGFIDWRTRQYALQAPWAGAIAVDHDTIRSKSPGSSSYL